MNKPKESLIHGSLFSGMGGFDLAAEWAGWKNAFHCEIDTFCQTILKYYWSNATTYTDITTTDFTIWRNRIDVLSGGFPCQPYSLAGNRKGTDDERHLWPEMLRAIKEIKPPWVVGENVYGLTNWNGGMVFEQVCLDLENEGYQVQPYILPAASVNAPHRRDRVWFIAYSHTNAKQRNARKFQEKAKQKRLQERKQIPFVDKPGVIRQLITNSHNTRTNINLRAHPNRPAKDKKWKRKSWAKSWEDGGKRVVAHGNNRSRSGRLFNPQKPARTQSSNDLFKKPFRTQVNANPHSKRQQKLNDAGKSKHEGWANRNFTPLKNWENFPTQPPICTGNDGLSPGLDGITFSKWRNETIKASGNAVVPQVVLQLFETINKYNSAHN